MQMDSVKRSGVSSKKSKLARTFAKVLHIRMLTGVGVGVSSGVDGITEKGNGRVVKKNGVGIGIGVGVGADRQSDWLDCSDEDEKEERRIAMESLLAKVFAKITALKAGYAELQYAQAPFDVDGIQGADQRIVSELKSLSELKRCFVKKQFDDDDDAVVSAELVEQRSVVKMYEISVKKLKSQVRLKDSEIIFLKEKLEEAKSNNKDLEKRMMMNLNNDASLENLELSAINSNHFARVLRHTVKTVRSFVELLIDEMKCGGWDMGEAASAIEPDIVYLKEEHKCFAFEAFVCRVMFEGFHFPNFGLPNESLPPDKKQQKKLYFRRFAEAKSLKKLNSPSSSSSTLFAKFCCVKYLQLIHPKMESSLFGNLSQRKVVSSGEIPDTAFFATFADMARWLWLLHCLAFSFDPEASIFQVKKGSRFTDVYMKAVTEELFFLSTEPDLRVAFTVVPGFNIGKTVIQSQVYFSQSQHQRQHHHVKQPSHKKQR